MEEVRKVRIRRQWDDGRIGEVSEDDLHHVAWDTISGGVNAPAPQPFLHGYVWCTDVEGEIAHSCEHGPAPHWIKVCIVKKDNDSKIYQALADLAGPKPKREPRPDSELRWSERQKLRTVGVSRVLLIRREVSADGAEDVLLSGHNALSQAVRGWWRRGSDVGEIEWVQKEGRTWPAAVG